MVILMDILRHVCMYIGLRARPYHRDAVKLTLVKFGFETNIAAIIACFTV